MARLAATLKSELLTNLAPPPDGSGFPATEADAIEKWAEAWVKYFEDAESNSVPITVSALRTPTTGAKDLMKAGLAGLATTGAAALEAGITAFWGALVASPGLYFSGASPIALPTTLTGIEVDLDAIFAANISGEVSAKDAYDAIVNGPVGLHAGGGDGGTATFSGPIVADIE